MRKADIVAGLIGMAFSAFAFYQTLSFRQFLNVPIGPEFFPRRMAMGLFICSVVLVIQSILKKSKNDKPAPTISPLDRGMQRLFVGIAIIIAYALCWELLGFLIITPLAMFGMMLLLGFRKYIVMVIFSIGTTAAVFSIFSFILNIYMPLGLLQDLIF